MCILIIIARTGSTRTWIFHVDSTFISLPKITSCFDCCCSLSPVHDVSTCNFFISIWMFILKILSLMSIDLTSETAIVLKLVSVRWTKAHEMRYMHLINKLGHMETYSTTVRGNILMISSTSNRIIVLWEPIVIAKYLAQRVSTIAVQGM